MAADVWSGEEIDVSDVLEHANLLRSAGCHSRPWRRRILRFRDSVAGSGTKRPHHENGDEHTPRRCRPCSRSRGGSISVRGDEGEVQTSPKRFRLSIPRGPDHLYLLSDHLDDMHCHNEKLVVASRQCTPPYVRSVSSFPPLTAAWCMPQL